MLPSPHFYSYPLLLFHLETNQQTNKPQFHSPSFVVFSSAPPSVFLSSSDTLPLASLVLIKVLASGLQALLSPGASMHT